MSATSDGKWALAYDYAKTLLTISGAILAATVSFAAALIKEQLGFSEWVLLGLSWLALLAAIGFACLAHHAVISGSFHSSQPEPSESAASASSNADPAPKAPAQSSPAPARTQRRRAVQDSWNSFRDTIELSLACVALSLVLFCAFGLTKLYGPRLDLQEQLARAGKLLEETKTAGKVKPVAFSLDETKGTYDATFIDDNSKKWTCRFKVHDENLKSCAAASP